MIENEGRSLFVTGRAGTGKSTLLQLLCSSTRKKAVVLAPTVVAALNVGGQTIHSFFGFPPKPLSQRDIKKRRNRRLYTNLDLLIIDEISMVRADMLDNIDYFLRLNRDNPAPFGGLQVVFFGDLFQLPPVVSNELEAMRFQLEYRSPYFFSAQLFETGFSLDMLELGKVYRQENRNFLRLLEAVRLNRVDYDDLEDLNRRYLPQFEPEDFYITLSARNSTVDRINQLEISRLPTESKTYIAKITGHFNPKLYPAEPALQLKVGAQVMFVKNDPDKRFVNGTIGKLVKLGIESVSVQVEGVDGQPQLIETTAVEWEVLKYKLSDQDPSDIETEVIGTFTQLPLRLAWAVTIHKAQGKTFDKVIIDLGRGAFAHGQTYVALSRCRSLEGIVLKQRLNLRDILIDERVVEYYETHFL